MGIFDWKHWIVILIVVVLVFGTKKLRNIGEDLGGAVKGFKDGMREGTTENKSSDAQQRIAEEQTGQTIEGEVKEKTKS